MKAYPVGSVLKVTRHDTEEDLRRNLTLMRDHGLNTVVIWPAAFWWEKKSADYPFHTGKRILKMAEEIGLSVIMELAGQLTSMEYMPDFLVKPEYQTYKLDGGRERGQSSFGFVNYFHPEVREIITAHFQKAARVYRDFPALLGYDVFNETMYRSFDPWTMREFQDWLREKYGSIDRLNEVWERTYSDFREIEYEDWKWMSIMPEADYCIFRKEAITRFLKDWCDAVREADPDHLLIADNIHSQVTVKGDYDRPQDDYGLKTVVDEIGMSFYPKQVRGCMEEALRWEVFDGFYDASRREGFLISEMQTHIQALFNPTTSVKCYELKQWCMEAYAAGAKGLIYWMWRPFDKGLQTLGRGLVNYREVPTERLLLAGELQKQFSLYGPVKPLKSQIGIVYEPLSEDFQRRLTEAYPVEQDIYLKAIYGAYRACFESNLLADIIRMEEISGYRLVILTQNIVVTEKDAASLKAYVEQGGHLLVDGKFGIMDETSLMHGSLPGGPANDLTGQEFFDTDNEDNTICFPDGKRMEGFMGRDLMEVNGAEVLAAFPDGKPAVVRKRTGTGDVTMFNTSVFYGYASGSCLLMKELLKRLAGQASVFCPPGKNVLRVRTAETEDRYLIFAFNYTDQPVKEEVTVSLNGRIRTFSASLDAQETVIFEERK